jgi:hypothetical protein
MPALSPTQHEFLQTLLDTIEEEGKHRLNGWEDGFISDQFKRFEQYGDDTRMSPKQWAVIKKIAAYYNIEVPDDIS